MSDLWLPPGSRPPAMPRTRQTPAGGPWQALPRSHVEEGLRRRGAVGVRSFRRGDLQVIIAREPQEDGELRWHLSISAPNRYPTWDELADARYDLLPDELTMAMLLPPRVEYVNLHPTTFHLHELP